MTSQKTISRREVLKLIAGAPAALLATGNSHGNPPASGTTEARPQLLSDKPADVHRVLTCNILLDLPEHKGTMAWKKRRGSVCIQIIQNYNPDILCLQEVGHGQYQDFCKAFPQMASHGFVGPVSDAHLERFQQIRNVLFYRTDRYELTSAGGYVLSETPYLPRSSYPGVGLGRHVNWVRLRERSSGKEFRVLNTHLSLKQPTRIKETALIAAETRQYTPDFPQLMCGDFNSRSETPEIQNLLNAGWQDTYRSVDLSGPPKPRYKEKQKIDFIFSRGAVSQLATQYIDDQIDGVRPSDHPFVGADVQLT